MGDMLHNTIDWRGIADLMWREMTIQQACEELGYDYIMVLRQSTVEQRRFLLDTSMLASVRDEYLGGEG